MSLYGYVFFLLFTLFHTTDHRIQQTSEIFRIEFNAGSRTYREQTIITADSIITIKENFKTDKKPVIKTATNTNLQWSALTSTLNNIKLTEINQLKSPGMKRAHDAASHGSIIITTKDGKSYSHTFDNTEPHEKLQPLMQQITSLRTD